MFFHYGETEINYLKQKDKTLGAIIDKIGYIQREVDTDLFSSVVHHIVGQQISNKALATIWQRLQDTLTIVNAEHILNAGEEELRACGISSRKIAYITDFARKVHSGEFDLEKIRMVRFMHHRSCNFLGIVTENFYKNFIGAGKCLYVATFNPIAFKGWEKERCERAYNHSSISFTMSLYFTASFLAYLNTASCKKPL